MAITLYTYNKLCDSSRLEQEILASSITIALDHIETTSIPETTDIYFKIALSTEEQTTLDTLVENHENTPLPDLEKPVIITDGNGNTIDQLDTDNALIVRLKAAKKGWSFLAVPIELTTSTLSGSLYCKNYLDVDFPGVTCKIYNSNDEEITTAGLLNANLATCVKTVVDFEPTFDYEIIGGALRINSNPAQDIRLWIIGAPDIPAQYGGSKEFASGINLKFLAPDSSFDIDGRVTKFLKYDPVTHQGKMRLMLKHDAGIQVNMQFVVHIYRL